MFPHNMTSRIDYVREYHARTTKYFVFDSDAIINRNIILNLYPIANEDIADEHALTERTMFTDASIGADMDPVPDASSLADLRSVVNDGAWVSGEWHI